jgi:DNA-binding CsgD family transcriptional regulator
LPGRIDTGQPSYASVNGVEQALVCAAAAHGEHEKRTGTGGQELAGLVRPEHGGRTVGRGTADVSGWTGLPVRWSRSYGDEMAPSRTPAFRGRARERQVLDRLLDEARAGRSAPLVIRGEAGIGKTELLRYCARQASGCRLVQISGVESEMQLPLAALHQLCGPLLGGLGTLPQPQERALRVAFGLVAGAAPDRFMVGLAVLGLLAEASGKRPLVCLVDDAQWLDEASSQVMGFIARRLLAEAVVLLFAVREPPGERVFPDLPALSVPGLPEEDARALLTAAVPGHLDAQVRDRIVAETRGNPLGLLEMARSVSEAELAGGFAEPLPVRPSGSIQIQLQDHYLHRVRALPVPARRLMLLAAADPTGDATLLWRASQHLGIGPAAAPAAAQLLTVGSQVQFRHPLVRSAAYTAGSADDRRDAHIALAAATDARTDPERRVWHLAAAAGGPDEALAAELEQAARNTQARAGVAAAAALLYRSAALTADPARRADRALAAAHAYLHAGAFDPALGLLAEAEAAAVDDLQRARVEYLRGQIQTASNSAREAPVLLLRTAERLTHLDAGLARETYLDAWGAALYAGALADRGGGLLDVSRAARSAPPPPDAVRPADLLLDAMATAITDGRAAAAPRLREAVCAFTDDKVSADDWLHWGQLANGASTLLWDVDSWANLGSRQIERAREAGALVPLAFALDGRAMVATFCGDFDTAAALIAEENAIKDAIGMRLVSYSGLQLAGYQGRLAEASLLLTAVVTGSTARGEGLAVQMANWATAILNNGLGRYADAFAAAKRADVERYGQVMTAWVLRELIEAAARSQNINAAIEAVQRLSAITAIETTDWAAGLDARSRALVRDGSDAEACYTEAIELFRRTPLRPDLARTHLLYGEWLRRTHRRLDARHHLRTAYELFTTIGADAFAERARRELAATGEKTHKRDVDHRNDLTPQEEHIARLARDGRTNPEIGAELFLSARTVEWHLRKVFTKLGITSRRGLDIALPVGHQHQHQTVYRMGE